MAKQEPAPSSSARLAEAYAEFALSDSVAAEFEDELARAPLSLKTWARYIDSQSDQAMSVRVLLFERALRNLPGSYKLWKKYLLLRVAHCRGRHPEDPAWEALNRVFERALVTMHRMPVIWEIYLKHLAAQRLVTRLRRAFDRALRTLSILQHERIWKIYIEEVKHEYVPVRTAIRAFRRYVALEPGEREAFVEYCLGRALFDEAARVLAAAVNDEQFESRVGKTRLQLWLELCDLATRHAADIKSLHVEPIVRHGLRMRAFASEAGNLWCSLADYYIRRAQFEKARDVFEEAMERVATVRDFSVVFDAYAEFEESVVSTMMEKAEEDANANASASAGVDGDTMLDLRLARLDHLMDRRPVLLSSVLLRQNPHNVHEWHKRARLFEKQPARVVETFTEAVKTVDPARATGRPYTLWAALAKFYERHGDLDNARVVFEKGVITKQRGVEDASALWAEYAEMELRHKHFRNALSHLHRATRRGMETARSTRLWSMYIDLQESLGTVDDCRRAYDEACDLRVVTPQMIINFATFLEEHRFFEDSFRAFERGIALFKYPHVLEVWVAYLTKFLARYGGTKLERARDLFEQAIGEIPGEAANPIFLLYAQLEEEHGLARRAMDVYDRACSTLPDKEKPAMFRRWISRAAQFFGATRTREIYERAIEVLSKDEDVRSMCAEYAELERGLGEIDRARAVFTHGAQFADPRSADEFWQKWHDFEVSHGNEDTFREMLRVKRSVALTFSSAQYSVNEAVKRVTEKGETGAPEASSAAAAAVPRLADDMQALEQQGARSAGANPEELDLDDDDDDDDDGDGDDDNKSGGEESAAGAGTDGQQGVEIEQLAVPAAVFGAALGGGDEAAAEESGAPGGHEKRGGAGAGAGDDNDEPVGALARFKRRRAQ